MHLSKFYTSNDKMRVIGLMSGGGSNLVNIIDYAKKAEKAPYNVVARMHKIAIPRGVKLED